MHHPENEANKSCQRNHSHINNNDNYMALLIHILYIKIALTIKKQISWIWFTDFFKSIICKTTKIENYDKVSMRGKNYHILVNFMPHIIIAN